MLTDTAVMMVNGGNTMRDIDVLRHQRDLLGQVSSAATVCRALAEVDLQGLDRVDAARARVRAQVWDLIAARHGRIPPARASTGELGNTIVLRIDAHFIDAYSRKEQAGGTRPLRPTPHGGHVRQHRPEPGRPATRRGPMTSPTASRY